MKIFIVKTHLMNKINIGKTFKALFLLSLNQRLERLERLFFE